MTAPIWFALLMMRLYSSVRLQFQPLPNQTISIVKASTMSDDHGSGVKGDSSLDHYLLRVTRVTSLE
jgi:hypothetical protein